MNIYPESHIVNTMIEMQHSVRFIRFILVSVNKCIEFYIFSELLLLNNCKNENLKFFSLFKYTISTI